MSTNSYSARDIKRKWHLFDAKNKTLGRLSTEIAKVIMGKHKPEYVPYLDMGDFAVVINAKDVKVSGKKESQKKYVRHSGFPGGLRVETLAQVREIRPEKVLIKAVTGMVPGTKLGKKMIAKLHVYADSRHPYEKQLKGEEGKDAK